MASRGSRRSAATSSARKASRRSPAPRATSTTSRFPACCTRRTIRSTIPPARSSASVSIFDTAGFTIVDHRDIPGRNVVALIDDDQPCLAERDDPPRGGADPAARARGSRARCSPPTSRSSTARRRRTTTRKRRRSSSRRSPSTRAISSGASPPPTSIVEGEYRAGHQEQLYIEPNGVDRRARHRRRRSRCTDRCSARTTCTAR